MAWLRSSAIVLSATASVVPLAACGSSSHSSAAASASSARLRFSECMRAHGVSNFPDPSSNGTLEITPGSGIDPAAPAFEAAQKACGGGPSNGGPPKMSESERLAALHFSECMRTHGVPNFPDPAYHVSAASGPVLSVRGMLFAGTTAFNPRSAAFKHAAVACGVKLP